MRRDKAAQGQVRLCLRVRLWLRLRVSFAASFFGCGLLMIAHSAARRVNRNKPLASLSTSQLQSPSLHPFHYEPCCLFLLLLLCQLIISLSVASCVIALVCALGHSSCHCCCLYLAISFSLSLSVSVSIYLLNSVVL